MGPVEKGHEASANKQRLRASLLPAEPKLPLHSTIIWQAIIPPMTGSERLPHVLHDCFPDYFPSISAAKRIVRRRELYTKSSDKWHPATVLYQPQGGDVVVRAARTEMASVRSRLANKPPSLAQQHGFVKHLDVKRHFAIVVKPPGIEIGKEFREATFFAVGDTRRRDDGATQEVGPVLRRPVAVHRLDKVTGGLVVVALTEKAIRSFSSQFARREVSKTYRARVEGQLPFSEKIVRGIIGGRDAETHIVVVEKHRECTEVLLSPISGRKHQLRIHMKELGHLILFDMTYGSKKEHPTFGTGGICLWAERIALRHPVDGHLIEVTAKPDIALFPAKF